MSWAKVSEEESCTELSSEHDLERTSEGGGLGELIQGDSSVGGLGTSTVEDSEERADSGAAPAMVIDEQDALAQPRDGRGDGNGGCFLQDRGEGEGGATTLLALGGDGASHEPNELLRDGQAQAGATKFAAGGSIDLAEGGKEQMLTVFGNADPRILDREPEGDRTFVLLNEFSGEADFTARGEFNGIAAQVKHHLAEPAGIPTQLERDLRGDMTDKLKPFFGGFDGEHFGRVFQQGPDVKIDLFELELLGFDLGDIQDVVDEGEQGLAAVANEIGVLALLAGKGRAQEQRGHADHSIHRSADLVAHIGQELSFGDIGLLGLEGHVVGPRGGLFEVADWFPATPPRPAYAE